MKIHEYQAKDLLKRYGLPVPSGILCETPEEVRAAVEVITPCVLKAQVHSGGRGKAGGVKFAETAEGILIFHIQVRQRDIYFRDGRDNSAYLLFCCYGDHSYRISRYDRAVQPPVRISRKDSQGQNGIGNPGDEAEILRKVYLGNEYAEGRDEA